MRKNGTRESTKYCAVIGCGRGLYARGFCRKHYRSWRASPSFVKVVYQNRTCSLEKSDKRHHAGGYCQEHYGRFVRHGDPRKTVDRVGTSITEDGYKFIRRKGHANAAPDGRILEHRHVMAEHIGRLTRLLTIAMAMG